MKTHFRPEFLNRVDDIIIFHSLDEKRTGAHRGHPARAAGASASRNSSSRSTWTAAAKQLLAKEGYDPQFGARPLKRAIQEHLLDPLATKLLLGEFKPGDRIKGGSE